MKILKKIGLVLVMSAMLFGAVACGDGTGGGNDGPVVRDPSDTDDFRMNELTTLYVGLSWNADWYYDGIDEQNNPVYELYESAENIKVVNKFALPWDGYSQQISNGFITGDIPDAFFADQAMLDELIRNDLIVDMKPYYDQWAIPELKETLEYNERKNFAYAERDGKLYGIPGVSDDCDRPIMWIRSDWLEEINSRGTPSGETTYDTANNLRFHADGPKTLDEFWDLAYAFALEDPDGNGRKDTYGLSLSKNLDDLSLPIFNAYGAYPDVIEKQEDGSYKNLALEPEMKKPLQMLQTAVADRVIPSDYYNWDSQAAISKAGDGVIGIAFAVPYSPLWPLNNTLASDSGADWFAAPMITEDGSDFVPSRTLNATGYYVVRKGYEHPEVIIKMLNNMATSDPENAWQKGMYEINSDPANSNAINWMPIRIDRSTVNFERSSAFIKAIEAKKTTGEYDISDIAIGDIPTWNLVKQYEENRSYTDSPQGWAYWKTFMEGVPVAKSYHAEGEPDGSAGKYTDWIYPPTKTQRSKGSSLETLSNTFRINVISGKRPVSDFDQFVEDWMSGGGGQILLEMERAGY